MRASILLILLLLTLLPLAAFAADADDDDDGEGIVTEVEGTGNQVIVIEELVINVDAADIISGDGNGEAMGLVHRLLDMLQAGPGPQMMMHGEPGMPHPGMGPGGPGMGPDEFFRPFHPGMGPGIDHGPRTEIGPRGRRGPGGEPGRGMGPGGGMGRDGGPRVSDNVHGMMRGEPGMKHPGPRMMPPEHGMMPDGHGMMDMPGEMDPEFHEFMMQLAKLAWSDPEFREHLRAFVTEYRQAAGEHHEGSGPHHGTR